MTSTEELLDVVVIGAGQAGLSAAGQLLRKRVEPGTGFVVLDANDGPGGAWRHRWDALTFDAAHGIHDLPGMPLGTPDPREPASHVVSRYYGAYEERLELPVIRPVDVRSVDHLQGVFTVTAADGRTWRARTVINATGTWDSPYVPYYPGIAEFTGRQLHTRGFTAAEDFTGRSVLVVGGGTSALQFLLQLHEAGATTVWTTRRAPDWTDRFFDASWGVDVESSVSARTTMGLPPLSVVAATGLPVTGQYLAGIAAGVLVSRGPLRRITPGGAVLDGPGPDGGRVPSQGDVADRLLAPGGAASGGLDRVPALTGRACTAVSSEDPLTTWETPVDTILWATGFRASLDHLSPLHVRERGGGVRMERDGVTVAKMPGLFLVGYGASASTIGATRAGRRAAVQAAACL
ncbi:MULTISPECIES: NAD(P)-binding domain-containing protein [Citricoccus]|uniref:NAD(P)-binding domain-containing protein n=1 Tax=Citricoccus TaxID=169133 RepID=UPI000255F2A4|nr:NAD(P)-binding domain-containing protein [Citricoccus sp. CH26A]